MGRKWKIFKAIPSTLFFNLRYMPFREAVKLPVWIASNVRVKSMWRGGLVLGECRPGIVRIGFHEADGVDCYGGNTVLCIRRGGKWIVEKDVHVGHGAIVHVNEGGCLEVGSNFAVSGTTSIICSNKIVIGEDVQFSWNSLVMDSDAHKVYGVDGVLSSTNGEISIGDKVWIAANVTILKNSSIGNNCIIASNSLVNRSIKENDCLIAGVPAKYIKKILKWEL